MSKKIIIKHPTLLLDEEQCRANIRGMKAKADRYGLKFRPHFKTHQSAYIGKWFREYGVHSCTVSSVRMARYFAGNGWRDILLAFPVNVNALDEINYLASIINFQMMISSADVLERLEKGVKTKMGVRIEINTGQDRTGLAPENIEAIEAIIEMIERHPLLSFTGFYSHPGHTYAARGKEAIQKLYGSMKHDVEMLKNTVSTKHSVRDITIGDTPGCSVMEDFGPISEMSPGNFVFYDLMQLSIGSCQFDQLAVAMACPVVDVNRNRNEVIIHGGAVHFSKEYIEVDGKKVFAQVLKMDQDRWVGLEEGAFLTAMSQEHGIISTKNSAWLRPIQIGDIVYLMPAHSCLTADCMQQYRLTTGDAWIPGKLAGSMPG